MKKQITDINGKKHYIGRNIGTSGFIFKKEKDGFFILANKRGKDVSNHAGLWNCPCGHLEFDETLAQACAREIKEECQINIDYKKLKQYNIEDSPEAYNQNITVRFYHFIQSGDDSNIGVGTDGEKNKVEEVKWINIKDLKYYSWAFKHNKIILEILDNVIQY
jgi:ADP-ribose pyrophosphatase YjhB (NUDIX family)